MRVVLVLATITSGIAACAQAPEPDSSIPVPNGENLDPPTSPPPPMVSDEGDFRSGRSTNRLTNNRLTNNGLLRIAGVSAAVRGAPLDQAAVDAGMLRTAIDSDPEATVEFLEYVVKCALAPDQTLRVSFKANDVIEERLLPGALALAPYWGMTDGEWAAYRDDNAGWSPAIQPGACDAECADWVWSCLMAHVNYFGTPVEISVRGPHPSLAPIHPDEETSFALQEATFYGHWPEQIDVDPTDDAPLAEIGFIAPGWHVFEADVRLRICSNPQYRRLCPFGLAGTASDAVKFNNQFWRLSHFACNKYEVVKDVWGHYAPGPCFDGDDGPIGGPRTQMFTRPLTVFLREPIPVGTTPPI